MTLGGICSFHAVVRYLPLHKAAQNRMWPEIVQIALELLAWMPMLAPTGETRRWEAPPFLRRRTYEPWCAGIRWPSAGYAVDPAPVRERIGRDEAVRIVEEELERVRQGKLSAGLDPVRMAVEQVERHELVWIVSWTSAEYLRTRNPYLMLCGNGPYLVDRIDGSLHWISVVAAVSDEWETDYRARIRGQVVRTAVDDVHDEVRAITTARGRIHAMHTLRRRIPALSHAQVVEYVTALTDGDVPAHLVDIATGELVPPVDPFRSVTTVRAAHGRRPR